MIDPEEADQIRSSIAASMARIDERRGRRPPKMAADGEPTTYGQKGGTGPTAGRKTRKFKVTLPDRRQVIKRAFVQGPAVAYAYQDRKSGIWHYNSINSPDAAHLLHLTQCPVEEIV